MPLRVESSDAAPDLVVVRLAGKLIVGAESKRIESLVKDLLGQQKKRFVFDLTAVSYVDSTGMGSIAYCFAIVMRAGGAFRVAGADGRVRNLMKITRLDAVLEFYPTVAAASQDFVVTRKPGEQTPW